MSAYFQDVNSKVVLKFDLPIDIKDIRNQIGDYKEVTEEEYNAYKGIVKTQQPKPKQ